MAKPKKHWSGGFSDLRLGCEREPGTRHGSIEHRTWSASMFVERSASAPDHYCVPCTKAARLALAAESAPKPDPRSDSERYAELRKLVEAWQSAYHQNDKAQTKDHPITEGWLKHWLHFCDTQKPLLDWSHR